MVHASLQAYLRACIGSGGGRWWNFKRLRSELCKKQGKHNFENYRLLFLDDLGVDWNNGPVSLDELEQLNLTRNDLIHEVTMLSVSVKRDVGRQRPGGSARSAFSEGTEIGNMRYTVEFEMRSDLQDRVSESVRKALVSTFGSVDKFRPPPAAAELKRYAPN